MQLILLLYFTKAELLTYLCHIYLPAPHIQGGCSARCLNFSLPLGKFHTLAGLLRAGEVILKIVKLKRSTNIAVVLVMIDLKSNVTSHVKIYTSSFVLNR